jgi:hypothetical protein
MQDFIGREYERAFLLNIYLRTDNFLQVEVRCRLRQSMNKKLLKYNKSYSWNHLSCVYC